MSAADVRLDGKVAIVTGAAAGLGRAEALALAGAGASLVLSDVSAAVEETVAAAAGLGVTATAVVGDVADSAVADGILKAATDLGGIHVVVNNAGFLRDRMLFGMSDEEWDDVVRVHLRGHFLLSRGAAAYWRDRSKAEGAPVYGRLVNTASEAWLFGAPGQANYAAAKAGIAALTISAARGLSRYGVRANVICPRARTAMTAGVFGAETPAEGLDPLSVEHVAPVVAWLASPAADRVSGQVFVVHGGQVMPIAPPTVAHRFTAPGLASGGTWTPEDLSAALGPYYDARDVDDVFKLSDPQG